ncbi:uncharacterized protein JCM15063_006198 [Sporobolomyces koalae]|uniref:uncharacterized protein n=1 Tax=Sporobolomyces koalae TaxID=500713 RepID=UPI0031823FBA
MRVQELAKAGNHKQMSDLQELWQIYKRASGKSSRTVKELQEKRLTIYEALAELLEESESNQCQDKVIEGKRYFETIPGSGIYLYAHNDAWIKLYDTNHRDANNRFKSKLVRNPDARHSQASISHRAAVIHGIDRNSWLRDHQW